jgi:hypothetical protein
MMNSMMNNDSRLCDHYACSFQLGKALRAHQPLGATIRRRRLSVAVALGCVVATAQRPSRDRALAQSPRASAKCRARPRPHTCVTPCTSISSHRSTSPSAAAQCSAVHAGVRAGSGGGGRQLGRLRLAAQHREQIELRQAGGGAERRRHKCLACSRTRRRRRRHWTTSSST